MEVEQLYQRSTLVEMEVNVMQLVWSRKHLIVEARTAVMLNQSQSLMTTRQSKLIILYVKTSIDPFKNS